MRRRRCCTLVGVVALVGRGDVPAAMPCKEFNPACYRPEQQLERDDIPTVQDRLIQLVLLQVLQPILDPTFSYPAVARGVGYLMQTRYIEGL
jgi:hypothetical protein